MMTQEDLISLNTLSGEGPGFQGDPDFYEPYVPSTGGNYESVFDPNKSDTDGVLRSLTDAYKSNNFGSVDTGGLSGVFKSLFGDGKGGLDLLKLGAMGGGLAGLLGGNKSSSTPSGYQGSIPKYTAVRNMVTAPEAGRRPGAGGTRYGGDVTFAPKGSSAGALPPSSDGNAGIGDLVKMAGIGGLGYTAGKYLNGEGSKSQQPISKDDPFYQSPEFKAYQNDPSNMYATDDMYMSPYFGQMTSGSTGAAMDRAYEQYRNRSGAQPTSTTAGVAKRLPEFAPRAPDGGIIEDFENFEEFGKPAPVYRAPASPPPDFSKDEDFKPSIPMFTPEQQARSIIEEAPGMFRPPEFTPKAINTPPEPRPEPRPELMRVSNPRQYEQTFAEGGSTGRYLQGGTDGMADKIPAQIGEDQPAALSHGEFVIPADVVSHLGNGNSDAGAQRLYDMMDKIREARTGSKEQGKKINPDKFMPGGLAQAYAAGGGVKKFSAGGVSGLGTAANAGVTGTESNLSNWVGPYVTDMLGKGQALSELPYQEYGGPLTAGASPLQQQAFGTAANLSVPGSVGAAAQTAGDIATKAQGINYTPTTFGNQFQAPTPYQTTNFTSGTFGGEQAQQYMNPYLQASLNPQLAEARRQADITEQQNKAAMTKAGAFGGGRQAILAAEGQRNLGTNLANITGKGYDTAFQNAMSQFNADQARNMQAQQASEQSKQFGAGQGMTAAQQAAQYGLAGQQAGEASRQFGTNLGLQGLNTGLQAAQTQGNLGISGGQLGLANLQQQLAAGAAERGIESEGIAADKEAFEEARANPYKMVQYQQSLLSGLPLAAQNINTATPSTFQQVLGGAGSVASLLNTLGLGPKK